MSCITEFNQVIEGARQKRAERIGSSLRWPVLPLAVAVTLSLALSQAMYEPEPHAAFAKQVAQLSQHSA